ncbi:MAG: helix-turn-helix domain-containing protein [Betaproteobacteria bacterium]
MKPSDRQSLIFEVIRLSSQVRTVEDLDNVLDGPLRRLLGYDIMICGTGFYSEKGCYGYKYHSRDFPMQYFFELRNPADGSVDSPLMKNWRDTLKPVYFQGGRDDADYPADWIAAFNKYDLRNIIGHATLDRHGVVGDYFIFARLDGVVGPRHAEILELVIPNLSLALGNAMQDEVCDENFAGSVHALISHRQRDILQWIYQGKTNWEISKILEINEETIKYHVDQVMAKLNVKTRAQAVGRALEIGAISAIKRVAVQPPPNEEPPKPKTRRGK